MKFANLEDLELAAIAAENIPLTAREKQMIVEEFGEVLSKENCQRFKVARESSDIFLGYADRYVAWQSVNTKIGKFENFKKIDEKLGLFNDKDAVQVAISYFGYEVLEKSGLVQVKFHYLISYQLGCSAGAGQQVTWNRVRANGSLFAGPCVRMRGVCAC